MVNKRATTSYAAYRRWATLKCLENLTCWLSAHLAFVRLSVRYLETFESVLQQTDVVVKRSNLRRSRWKIKKIGARVQQ